MGSALPFSQSGRDRRPPPLPKHRTPTRCRECAVQTLSISTGGSVRDACGANASPVAGNGWSLALGSTTRAGRIAMISHPLVVLRSRC